MDKMNKIAILDFGHCNIGKLNNFFLKLKYKTKIVKKFGKELDNFDIIVLPGLGNFSNFSKNKIDKKFRYFFKKYLKSKKFICICLGFQLLFKGSEESLNIKGLDYFNEKCLRLKNDKFNRVPNIGFRETTYLKKASIEKKNFFYYAHSYYVPYKKQKYVTAISKFGKTKIIAVIEKKNILAVQFHPEMSGDIGKKIITNFLK